MSIFLCGECEFRTAVFYRRSELRNFLAQSQWGKKLVKLGGFVKKKQTDIQTHTQTNHLAGLINRFFSLFSDSSNEG